MRSVLCAVLGSADVVAPAAMWRNGAVDTYAPLPSFHASHVPAPQFKREAVTFALSGIRGSAPPVG